MKESIHWKLQDTNIRSLRWHNNGKISPIHGMGKLILLKCWYYPRSSTDSMQRSGNVSNMHKYVKIQSKWKYS